MKNTLKIKIENELTQLEQVNRKVKEFTSEQDLDQQTCYNLNLVLEEILTNIISYAYDDSVLHSILINLIREGDLLRLKITDDGRPFDPTATTDPDLTDNLEKRRIGGLGLYLVKNTVESMSYQRLGSRNILDISIKIK